MSVCATCSFGHHLVEGGDLIMRVSPLLIRGSVWYSPLTDHSNESIAAIGDTVTDPINESIANGDTLIKGIGQGEGANRPT